MWKESLIARFRRRSSSLTAQGAPLISSLAEGSRPLSTATLDSVQEPRRDLERNDEQQPCKVPSCSQVPETPNGHGQQGNAQVARDIESNQLLGMRSLRSFFMEELDAAQAVAPLSAYCFMTGFIDGLSFSAIFVWYAFQTGNSIQLALALARLFNGQHDYSFHIADQQALCSVLCFILGAFLGRIGDKIGSKTRLWMTVGTFIQTLFTMSGAIVIWKSGSGSVGDNRGNPAWSNTLSFVTVGFMSASMGLQGIMGKRLNTQFSTTVVLTSTWCELMTEPQLFNFGLVASRDQKVMAIAFLFFGAFISRVILDRIGSAGALGVATGLRFAITLWWLFVPVKKAK